MTGSARDWRAATRSPASSGSFSVLDNLALAVQARSGSSFSFWRPLEKETALFEEARRSWSEIGLARKESPSAATLSHGEQRALEVGLALATQPKLVLLDEPMAGMGPEESRRMIELIERIRAGVTVLLVEHDMDAVFRLADRISVMVDGRLIATDARKNQSEPGSAQGLPRGRSACLRSKTSRRRTARARCCLIFHSRSAKARR